jgi:tetratricopeptide (TPR) repeat protein
MMPVPKINSSDMSLQVERKPLQLFIHAGETEILTFVLPPTDDLDEVRSLGEQHAQLERLNANEGLEFLQDFKLELGLLEEKFEQFSDSPTYLTRLANFAAIVGDRDAEARYLALAREQSSDPLIVHRLGENLIARDRLPEAEHVFSGLDLGADLYANLRIASLSVQRKDMVTARSFIDTALRINALDYGARVFDGALCIIERRYPEAIRSFRVAIEDRPNSASAHANMAIAYKLIGLSHKALSSLKRAVVLDPINPYFVGLLSDIAYEIGEDADALPSLRYYVQFDQTRPDMWSRVARACFRMGLINDAEHALKREGSIKDSVAVWNNLGVCHHRRKEYPRALSAFKHAFLLNSNDRSYEMFQAARNAAQTLAEMEMHEQVVDFTSQVISFDRDNFLLKTPVVSDIHALRIQALLKLRHFGVATQLGRDILHEPVVASDLVVWTVASMVGLLSLRDGLTEDVRGLISQYWTDATRSGVTEYQWSRFVNNIAFAFAEAGNITQAEEALRSIGPRVGADAYPTATQGLVQMRKGNVERGVTLYERAISLAPTPSDKARIKQKLNLELGRFHAQTNVRKSQRFLEKVIGVKGGERQLEVAAEDLLRGLRARK